MIGLVDGHPDLVETRLTDTEDVQTFEVDEDLEVQERAHGLFAVLSE